MDLYDDHDDAQPGFDYSSASPLVRLLHQVFAQPVARLGDLAPQLLAGLPAGPAVPQTDQMAAAMPAGQPGPQAAQSAAPIAACFAPGVSARDNAYLNKYYGPVAAGAAQYNVNPAFVLGNGYESGYADPTIRNSTYVRSGDAFGMTRGGTNHMTYSGSPQENVDQLFQNYGRQTRNVGDDPDAYVNGLRGRDPSGTPVKGWQIYNQEGKGGEGDPRWDAKIRAGMKQMVREVPVYAQYCAPGTNGSGQ